VLQGSTTVGLLAAYAIQQRLHKLQQDLLCLSLLVGSPWGVLIYWEGDSSGMMVEASRIGLINHNPFCLISSNSGGDELFHGRMTNKLLASRNGSS